MSTRLVPTRNLCGTFAATTAFISDLALVASRQAVAIGGEFAEGGLDAVVSRARLP